MKRRTTYAVLAWLLGVLGLLAVVVGALLAVTFGQQGQLRSASSQLSGPGAAIILEQLQVDATSIPVPDGLGTLTIDVDPVGPRALFVGTATPADLDGYLKAVPYDVVTVLAPGGRAETRSVPGSALPGPPGGESFWKQQKSGTPGGTVSLQADLAGDPSLVVMNAVPADGVEADVVVTLTIAWVWKAAVSMLLGGAAALLLCVLLAWRSHVAGRRARAERAGAAPPRPTDGATAGATVLPVPTPHSPPAPVDTTAPIPSLAVTTQDDATRVMPRITDAPPHEADPPPGQGDIAAQPDTRH